MYKKTEVPVGKKSMLLPLRGLVFRTERSILASLLRQSSGCSSRLPASPRPVQCLWFVSLAAAEHSAWPMQASSVGTKRQRMRGGERELMKRIMGRKKNRKRERRKLASVSVACTLQCVPISGFLTAGGLEHRRGHQLASSCSLSAF